MPDSIDVLIPTKDHPEYLTATLVSLSGQTCPHIARVFVRDEGDTPAVHHMVVVKALDLLSRRWEVHYLRDSRRGTNSQHSRACLCEAASGNASPLWLSLDDDIVFCTADAVQRLWDQITQEGCTAPWAAGACPDLDNNKEWPDFDVRPRGDAGEPWHIHDVWGPVAIPGCPSRRAVDGFMLWRSRCLCATGHYRDWAKMPKRGFSCLVRRRVEHVFGLGLFVPYAQAWHIDSNTGVRDIRFQDTTLVEALFNQERDEWTLLRQRLQSQAS